MMKRALALLLSFAMVFSMLPVSAFAETTDATDSNVTEEVIAPDTPTEGAETETENVEEEITETEAVEETSATVYVEEVVSETVPVYLGDGTVETEAPTAEGTGESGSGSEETTGFGQSEFDATIEVSNDWYWLMQDMTITSDVTFNSGVLTLLAHNSPAAKSITIADGATLTISDGSTLLAQNGSAIVIEDGGKLVIEAGSVLSVVNNSSLTVKAGGTLTTTGAVVEVNASSLTVEGDATLNADSITVGSTASISGVNIGIISVMGLAVNSAEDVESMIATYSGYKSLNMYAASSFSVTADLSVPSNAKLTIPADIIVTIGARVTLENKGTIVVASGGTLLSYGTLVGVGTLDVQEGGNYIEEDAPMEFVTFEVSSAEELASNLADCQSWQDGGENKRGDLYVTADIVLAQNITIPSNAYVNISGGSLEISSGYTLTNNGGILVDNGKTLTVSENAVLNNQGDIYVAYGATLVNNGEISGIDPLIITTPPVECVEVTTADELIEQLGAYKELMVTADITLSGEITIPENCYIWVGDGNLIIASDCTLTNNGKIGVYSQHTLTVVSGATMNNANGTVTIGYGCTLSDEAGVLENNGTVIKVGEDSTGGETESGDNLTWEVSEDGVLTIGGEGDMNPEYVMVTAPWCADEVKDTVLKIVFEAGVTSITSDAFWALSKVTEIEFLGVAPSFDTNSLSGLTATAYYPADNETWTSDVMQNYGGTITWSAAGDEETGTDDELSKVLLLGTDGFYTLTEDITITGESTFNKGTSLLLMGNTPALTKTITIADGGKLTISGSSTLVAQNGGSIIVEDGGELVVDADSYLYVSSGVTVNDGGTLTNEGTVTVASGGKLLNCGTVSGAGTLDVQDGGTYVEITASGTCGADLTWQLSADGVLTISGTGAMYDYMQGEAPWYGQKASITSIVVEEGVTAISTGAFYYLDKVTSISYPASLESGADYTGRCTGIEEYIVAQGNTHYYTYDGALLDAQTKELLAVPAAKTGSFTVPAEVTRIGAMAFEVCTGLTEVTLNEGLKEIGEGAFGACTALTSLSIPSTVVTIEGGAFRFCSALTEILLPEGIIKLDNELFFGCSNLESITIPQSVTSIGDTVFCECGSLTEIVIPAGVSKIEVDAFSLCTSLTKITFEGNAPEITGDVFADVTATAYYPADNSTWTSDVMQDYGGTITWVIAGEVVVTTAEELIAALEAGATSITVIEDITLTEEITIPENVTLTNNAYISAQATINVNGTVQNNGYILSWPEVPLVLGANGKVEGNPAMYADLDLGVRVAVTNEKNLRAMLEDTNFGGSVVTAEITLTDNLENWGKNICVGNGGNLIVPAGMSLTHYGRIEIWEGGKLTIQGTLDSYSLIMVQGGELIIGANAAFSQQGDVIVESGDVKVLGSITGNAVTVNAANMANIGLENIPNVIFQTGASSTDELKSAVALSETYSPLRVNIGMDMTVTESITIPANVSLNFISDQMNPRTFTVAEGVTLTMDTGMYVNPFTKLVVNGSLINNVDTNIEGTLTVNGSMINKGALWVNINGSMTVAANAGMVNYGVFHIGFGPEDQNYTSTVSIDGSITTYGYFNVTSKGVVNVSGTLTSTMDASGNCGFIQINGQMNVSGALNNYSNPGISLNGENAALTVTGTLNNNSGIQVDGSTLDVSGGTYAGGGNITMTISNSNTSVTGADEANFAYLYLADSVESLENAIGLADSYSHLNISVVGDITLAGNVTVPENVDLILCQLTENTGVEITVPDGVTLTNEGYIEVNSYCDLTVASGGTLHNNSKIKVYGGTVTVNGTYSSDNDVGIDIDLMSGGTVNGDVVSNVKTGAYSYNELKILLEKAAEYGYQKVVINLYDCAEISENLTVPENVNLYVIGYPSAEGKLIVPNGVTLTLNGVTSMNDSVLTVQEGGKVVNNSDLTINAMPNGLGSATFDGEFVNNGTFWVNTGSSADINGAASNYGNIHVGFGAEEIDCQLNINGTLDNYGYLNVTPTGKLSVNNTLNINAEGEYCGFLQAGGNVQVDGTLNVNGLLTVGNEEENAVLYVSPNGTLNVADTEIEICDGQIGIDGKLNVTNAGVINNGFLCLNRGSVSTFDKNSCLTNKNFLHVGMGPDEEKYTSILNMNGVLENYSYFNVHPKGYVSVAGEMNVYIEGEYWGFLDIFGQVEVSGTLNNYGQITVSGSLTVPGTLNNEMGVDVEGGTLDVSEGTYTGYGWIQQNVKTSADSVIGVENANFNYYYPVESVKELRSALRAVSNYGWLNVDVWKSFSVNADITIPENVSMSLYGDESDATEVIISSGVTMTNKGTVQIYSNASLTFQSDSAMANNGTLLVDGGTLNMNGTYSSDYGSIAEVNLVNGGSVVGTDYCYVMDVYDAEELQSALSESAKHSADPVAIRVNQSISIDNNIEIPANVTVNVSWAEVVVAEGVTVTNNGSLQIHEESTLTNEGTLVNNNEMIVWERGVLNNTGTISGNTPIRYSEDGNQIATSEAELRRALENDQDCSITVQGTVTLTDNLEISSGDSERELYVDAGGEIIASDYSLILNCYTCINPGGKITIGENGKLVNNADLEIYGSGITVVARSIDAGDSATGIGKLTVAAGGSLENGGGITVDGGAVILEETTSYTETTASAEVLTYLNSGSKVQNIDEAYITKVCTVATLADLQYWLGQAESYDELTIDITASFNVTENVTIPANVTVNLQVVEGNTFRMDIDSGVTVSVDGALNVVGIKTEDGYAVTGQINVEGSLEVHAGGKLNNAGYIEVMSTAKLAVDTGATYTGIFNVHEGAAISNIQNSDIQMTFYAETDAELREGLSATGYNSINVLIVADFKLTDSLEIPAGLYVYVGNGSDQNATLTVPATVTLTNNGILAVQAGSAIVIEEGGSVSNNSTMPVMGDLTNNGKLVNNSYLFVTGEFTGTGTVEGSGFTSKQKEVRTVEQLQAALDEAENRDLNYEIYVTAPITLTQDVIIKNNVNMYLYSEVTVPEGISLTNNSLLALGSNLIVAKGGAFYDYGTCMSNEGYYLGKVYPETGAIYENGEAEHPYTVEEDLVENVWGQGYATVHEEYYRWTAEVPGTLKLSYSEGGSVSGLDEYVQGDGFVTVTMAAGDTVEFCVSGDGTETTVVYEASFEPTLGASLQYPIEISTLPFTVNPASAHELYYSYTADKDFTLTVESSDGDNVTVYDVNGEVIEAVYDVENGVYTLFLTADEKIVMQLNSDGSAVYTLRYSYVAQNSNGELYESVVEALAAAKKGETVKLLRDCGAEYLLLLKGITLDLNGYALTAVDGAVAIKGNTVIDSTEGTGILIVAKDALVLDEANTQLPVWTGSGYQFTTVIFNQMNQNVTGNSFTFRFKPNMTSSSIQTYLQTNLVNSGLSVVVRVTWKSGADTVCQDFIYGVETAQLVFVKGTLTLSVSGIGNFEDVTATAMVVSDAKVNAVGKTLDAGVAGE